MVLNLIVVGKQDLIEVVLVADSFEPSMLCMYMPRRKYRVIVNAHHATLEY